ncbi:MAG: sulfotransferase domain-containing protein [Eubacteriales bacterium]|nr:sulfotransferase domain-containing protein [Eubacteriales bacterium]
MNRTKQITTEEELKQSASLFEHVILYGEKSLVVILLRYYWQQSLDTRVTGISYATTKKDSTGLLEKPLKNIQAYPTDETTYIYVLGRTDSQTESLCSALHAWPQEHIIPVDYELLASLSRRDNLPMDFLCVGFTKCCSTSLHTALSKHKQIYLPRRKELLYGRWKNRYIDAPERFQRTYLDGNSPTHQKLGSIEPTFFFQSHFVYETYGKKPKIIFLVRNPVGATYSYFIMMMKRSMDPKLRTYYHKYKKFTPEMFHDYLHDYIYSGKDQRFCYTKWIKEYLRYYDPDSIHIVFMEDLICHPESTMNEIQTFLDVQPKKYTKLPHSNPGNRVARNYLCARINGKLQTFRVNIKSASQIRQKLFTKLFTFIWKFTLVETKEKISKSDQLALEAFYYDSVRELEQITKRDLKDLWF